MENLNTQNIGFIGAGHLTRAMLFGLLKSGLNPTQIWLSNRSQEKLNFYQSQGIHTTLDNNELVFNSNIVVLATRPVDLKKAINQIKNSVHKNHLIISVVAGIESSQILAPLNQKQPLIRAMPNTPSSVQMAMTGLWANDFASKNQKQLATEIFEAMGQVLWLKTEKLIHLVTAISGSGPAYILKFMQAMIDAGVEIGLSQDEAKKLTIQTTKGAALLAEKSNFELSELVNQIAVSGGVTEQAINQFNDGNLTDLVKKAIKSAHKKSKNI